MSDEPQNETSSGIFSGRLPIIFLAILAVISLAAVCGLGYTLLRSSGEDNGGEEPGEPTPFPGAVDSGIAGSVTDDALVYGISDTTTVSVTLDVPVTLSFAGRNLAVQAVTINADGSWSPVPSGGDSAGWVYGSIVNYIMGLPPTEENRTTLESLTPGSQMVLTTQSGAEFIFESGNSRMVAANDQSIFSQLTPGMTVALMETGETDRLVVNGRYLLTETIGGASSGSTMVGVGETAQLSDVQVTVTGVTYLPNDPNTPPGFAFYIVNFQIFNAGTTAVDVSKLQLTLVDEIGNQYALNPVASRLGENAPLTGGFLNPGTALPISVGYQVPDGLVSTSVTVTVTRTDTGDQVQVNLPFSGSDAAQHTVIALQSVEVSSDLASMNMVGTITNNGDQAVLVTQEDVWLRTPEGSSYLMLSTNPPFPWTVPPGQTLQYAVTFQTPIGANTAIFTVLNQSFQLENLSS